MTDNINVEAAAKTFLATPKSIWSAIWKRCVHCGQCAEACHFYEASGNPKHTPAYKLFPDRQGLSPSEISARLAWAGAAHHRRRLEGMGGTAVRYLHDVRALHDGLPHGDRHRLDRRRRAPSIRRGGAWPEGSARRGRQFARSRKPAGPYRDKLRDRIEWLEDEHEVPIALDKGKADVLLTVSSIEAMKYPESIVAMAKLLNHAGVNWTLSTKGLRSHEFRLSRGQRRHRQTDGASASPMRQRASVRKRSSFPNAATPSACCAGRAPTCSGGRCPTRCCTSRNSWRS